MTKSTSVLAGAALVLAAYAMPPETLGRATLPPRPFAIATVHFEQNVTDGDVEVVFEVKGGADGLSGLTVVGPDGRTVMSFEAPDKSTLGLRQFRFESPEPKDVASIKAAYPEGAYVFAGWTAAGDTLAGESTLSHRLPPPATIVHPKPEATGVATRDLTITWKPVNEAVAYVVKIEQEESGEKVEARLPATTARFAMPAGFLRSGTEYQLGIGTVSDKGNVSVVETTFATARSTAAGK